METLKFKSNIKCTGCLKKVTPHLNNAKGIITWDVELEHPEKIVTVEGEGITAGQISDAVSKAGFKVEQIK